MRMKTKSEALEIVRKEVPCSTFLEHGRHDRKSGNMYICPFCESGTGREGTGALKVYPTNTWYCHACKRSGDVLDLIEDQSGIDFNDALDMAAGMIDLEYDRNGQINDDARAARKNDIKKYVVQDYGVKDFGIYYHFCQKRLGDARAVSYLSARGISQELAELAGLGFDPEADPARAPGGEGTKLHTTPRIIIPTSASHYIGRAIDPNIEKRYAKLNPCREMGGGEPGIFNSGTIYGAGIWLDRQHESGATYKTQRLSEDPIFVVEGAFDALSVCEVGQFAIALNSTSNTKKLIETLQKDPADRNTKFIVAFDNDSDERTAERTRAAAEGLVKDLNALGYKSITADIAGQYKDANEALQRNKEELREMVNKAVKEVNRDYLEDFLDKIQTEAYKPHKTGLEFWDNMMCGGVEDQQLIILMAAPGTGKTTLCQELAEEMAAHHKSCIYLNLEMSREQMLSKAISYHLARSGKAWLSSRDILHGYEWTPERKQLIEEAMQEYRQKYFPWIKYATIGNDLDNILEYLDNAGKAAEERGEKAPAVVLDYLHLIGTSRKMDVQELIKAAVTGLKQYAIKYNTFVVLISATGRSSTGRINLNSGRDSSNIEYTGDIVLSLDFYEVDKEPSIASDPKKMAALTDNVTWRQMVLRGLKGRFFAPGGKVNLYFNAKCNYFIGENDWIAEEIARTLPKFIELTTPTEKKKRL